MIDDVNVSCISSIHIILANILFISCQLLINLLIEISYFNFFVKVYINKAMHFSFELMDYMI